MARHWREYDDRLVKLGEEMFSGASGFLQLNIEKVKQELEELNRGKVGRPYQYPRFIIQVGMGLSKFMPYRQASGALKGIFGFSPHYVTLRKRILKESEHWDCREIREGYLFTLKDVEAGEYFIDSTGLACSQTGEWRTIRFEEKRVRKWFKLHVLHDERGKIVAFAMTESRVSDSEVFEELVRNLPPGAKVYGDRAYSSRKNYKIAKSRGIKIVSPPKKNFSSRRRGCKELQQQVKLLKKYGYEKWSRITGYFKRFAMKWVFSIFKRLFGEKFRAKSLETAFFAVLSSVMLFNTIVFHNISAPKTN